MMIQKLQEAIDIMRQEIARSRAFNSGLSLGRGYKEEAELYHHFRYLDGIQYNLSEGIKVIEEVIKDMGEERVKMEAVDEQAT